VKERDISLEKRASLAVVSEKLCKSHSKKLEIMTLEGKRRV